MKLNGSIFFLDLYLYSVFLVQTISRFWMCSGWEFIIFDRRNIFLGPQGPTGTILVPVEIKLVPRFGLPPSSRTLIRMQSVGVQRSGAASWVFK